MSPEEPSPPAEGDRGDVPAFPGTSQVRRLRSGGMGTVFRAWQEDLARWVAVKTIRRDLLGEPGLRERFTREARVLASLRHPNIVPAFSLGEVEGQPYYVMPFLEGRPLDEALEGSSFEDLARAFEKVARALEVAHQGGVLHRDLKPANVLVDDRGEPMLVDFGLSKRVAGDETTLSRPGALAGTPDYLAPEVVRGRAPAVASDVYGLGACLFRLLTGQVPYPEPDLFAKLQAIVEAEPPLPRELRGDVPRALQAICLKAMEREPDDRYASAAEMADDLGRFAAGEPVETWPRRSRTILRRKVQRHLDDLEAWERQGVLDAQHRGRIEDAYERAIEGERSVLHAAWSVPHLLVLAGILLAAIGPTILVSAAWPAFSPLGRLLVPALSLGFLTGTGVRQWRRDERRGGFACLMGASLLLPTLTFLVAGLVPGLDSVQDADGMRHDLIVDHYFAVPEEAAWMPDAIRRVEGKVLLSSLVTLVATGWLFRRTRAGGFLWLLCMALVGTTHGAARLLGWSSWPEPVQAILTLAGGLALCAGGLPFDRRWGRPQARPFYGVGFLLLVSGLLHLGLEDQPAGWLGWQPEEERTALSLAILGALLFGAGCLSHRTRSPALLAMAGLPLVTAMLIVQTSLFALATAEHLGFQLTLVATGAGFLVAGVALQRNLLVLLSALALPAAIGRISQHHLDSVWAWSVTLLSAAGTLVFLGFRMLRTSAGPPGLPRRGSTRNQGSSVE